MLIGRDESIFVICLICALIRVYINIEKHLDYDFKIVPLFSINQKIHLPVVSICLTQFLDEIKFQKFFPEISQEIGNLSKLKLKSVRKDLYNRITLKQLLKVSYSLDDFLEYCTIYDQDMNRINCSYLSPVVTWISFENKCFQFFAFRGQFENRFVYNRDLLVNHEWLVFSIKKKNIRENDIGILVSSPFELLQPFAYNTGYIQISTTFLSTLYIIIERFKTFRLPSPFDSNCFNYTGHYLSQMHCIYGCFYRKFKPLGLFPDQLLTRYPEELFGVDLDYENRTVCTESCNKKDCTMDKFQMSISYKKFSEKSKSINLVIKNSFSEEKTLNFVPSNRNQNVLSKVSFILSPLAFFCGISLFTIQLYFVNFSIYLIAVYIKIKKSFGH